HDVERPGVVGQRDPVADRLVGAALEHPAVDQDAGSAGLEQVLRAGDGGGTAEEVEVHLRSVAPTALRHRNGLPAGTRRIRLAPAHPARAGVCVSRQRTRDAPAYASRAWIRVSA